MTLGFYIARRFLWTFLRILGVFYGMMVLIDAVDQVRTFSDEGIGAATALQLAALNTPAGLYRVLPLVMILSAIALFVGLARTSELVVIRAAGRSALRFLVAPVAVALGFGLFSVAVLNPLVAATSQLHDTLVARIAVQGDSVLSVSEDGLWLRQGGATGQTVIQAARSNQDGTTLFGATFVLFDTEGLPAERIEAEVARLLPGGWQLEGAKAWNLRADNPERMAASGAPPAMVPTDLTVDAIRNSFGEPSAIPIWSLPAYIDGLERAGFSARSHWVWLHMELAQPVLLAAMVLLAAGFTMRHTRFGKTGYFVLIAILGGFGIFFLRNFAQVMGDTGQIPVLLAAWSAPVVASLSALGLLLHVEDG
ncbi:MAG: export transporter permease LptG [Pseudomonadota bacterium]